LNKTTLTADISEVIKTLELMGKLTPQVANIVSPKAHELRIQTEYLDQFLPEQEEFVEFTHLGKKKQVKIQRGDLITSEMILGSIHNLFWKEYNSYMRGDSSELDKMMISTMIKSALEQTEKEYEEKFVEKYLEKRGISYQEILEHNKHEQDNTKFDFDKKD